MRQKHIISRFTFHAIVIIYSRERTRRIASDHTEEVLEMLSKTHAAPVHSAAPGVIPDTITAPGTNGGVSTQPAKPAHGQPESGRDSAPSERDERRDREERQHQRAARREANGPEPGAKASGRLHQAQSQATAPSGRTRLALGKTVPLRLIGIIVVGLIVGAILGAASAPGWVIGLLVATVTVILSAPSTASHASADAGASARPDTAACGFTTRAEPPALTGTAAPRVDGPAGVAV
jgi:hypothetical protein